MGWSGDFDPSRRRFIKIGLLTAGGLVFTACGLNPSKPDSASNLKTAPQTTPNSMPTFSPEATPTPEKAILWKKDLLIPPNSAFKEERDAYFTIGDHIVLTNLEGYPASYDLSTGKEKWRWEDKGTAYGTEAGAIYVFRADGRLYSLDQQTKEIKWKFITESNESPNGPLGLSKERVILPLLKSLFLLDKKDGRLINNVTTKESVINSIGQTENRLVFSTHDKKLLPVQIILLRLNDGASKPLTPEDRGFPPQGYVSGNYLCYNRVELDFKRPGTLPMMPKIVKIVTVMDIEAEKILWQEEIDDAKILNVSKDKFYVSYGDGTKSNWLGILDYQTGQMLPLKAQVDPSQTFFEETEDMLILFSQKSIATTYAIDFKTPQTLWANDDLFIDNLIGTSKNTFIATGASGSNRFLYGLSPKEGKRKWRVALEQNDIKPLILGEKVVYSNGFTLNVLNPESGLPLYPSISLSVKPTRLSSAENIVFVQSGNPGGRGTLTAIKI